MEFVIVLLGYFIIGWMLDVLATIDVIAVQQRKALRSFVVSLTNTIISYVIFFQIMHSPQYLIEIIFYALGGASGGAWIILKDGKLFNKINMEK